MTHWGPGEVRRVDDRMAMLVNSDDWNGQLRCSYHTTVLWTAAIRMPEACGQLWCREWGRQAVLSWRAFRHHGETRERGRSLLRRNQRPEGPARGRVEYLPGPRDAFRLPVLVPLVRFLSNMLFLAIILPWWTLINFFLPFVLYVRCSSCWARLMSFSIASASSVSHPACS
jgi:hypothetical protein